MTNQLEAREITEWMFTWISNQKTSTSSSSQQPPARAFQLALQQANTVSAPTTSFSAAAAMDSDMAAGNDDHGNARPKKDLRSRISNRGVGGDLRGLLSSRKGANSSKNGFPEDEMDVDRDRSGGPQRKERRMDHRRTPYAPLPATTASTRQRQNTERPLAKCSFYPNCSRQDCPFHHPFEPCPDGIHCTKGKACLYVHETATSPAAIACKYAEYCTNPHCTYSHPSPASIALAKATKMAAVLCKYYPGCLNTQCPFLHDPTVVVAAPAHVNGTDTAAVPPPAPFADPQQTVCRFDPNCTRYGCYFLHPSRDSTVSQATVVPLQPSATSAHKTWVAPHISERQFATATVDESMNE